jgi:hypothetical protein
MLELLQLEMEVALVPLNATELVPCDAPKLLPAIVTDVPAGPEAGESVYITSGTVKSVPVLDAPLTVTTMLPVEAPFGTSTVMLVVLQLDAVPALRPLNVTVLEP